MRPPANPRSSTTHRVNSARRESLASITSMLDHSDTANAAVAVYRLRRSEFAHGFSRSSRIGRRILPAGGRRGSRRRHVPRAAQAQALDHRRDHPERRSSHPDRQRRRIARRATGFAVLTGHVQLHQDQRTVAADRVTYDEKTGKVTVAGSVDFEDPRLGVKSERRRLRCPRRRRFRPGQFPASSIATAAASPRKCRCSPDGKVQLDRCATRPARSATRTG